MKEQHTNYFQITPFGLALLGTVAIMLGISIGLYLVASMPEIFLPETVRGLR